MLNSPFLDWNLPKAVKRFAIPLVSLVGAVLPHPRASDSRPAYGMSHKTANTAASGSQTFCPTPTLGGFAPYTLPSASCGAVP